MSYKYLFLLVSIITSFNTLSAEPSLEKKQLTANACGAEVVFSSPFSESRSRYKLSGNSELSIFQFLSTQPIAGATLASNITCQSLKGSSYSGSEQEWQSFFDHTFQALSGKGAKNLKMTITGTDRIVYKGSLPFREYKFFGNFNEGEQTIFNLTVLNKKINTLYTISVSGHSKIENKVMEEFKRLVNSVNFEKLDD